MNEKKFFFKTKIHFYCPKQALNKFFWRSFLAHNSIWVHFVTKVSLHFWNQHKILRFLIPIMWGFFWGPSYVHARIFRAISGSARSIEIFFCRFRLFYFKMKQSQFSERQVSKIKFSLKINSPYCVINYKIILQFLYTK
jgi:hypothetical protein